MNEIIHRIEVAVNSLKAAAAANDTDTFIGELEELEGYLKDAVDKCLVDWPSEEDDE